MAPLSSVSIAETAWTHCERVLRPMLDLAPVEFLNDVIEILASDRIQGAVAARDTAAICEWMLSLIDRQGISNRAALAFRARQGRAQWPDLTLALSARPRCTRLRSHWHFEGCGYRKDQHTCVRPDLIDGCVVPRVGSRKGSLSQAAVGLALFVRDVCDGDIVGWIDDRLVAADRGAGGGDRAAVMRAAVVEPLQNIAGTGPKVWSMILAQLLLGADPQRERWVTTGASMIAIDSIVHGVLHRTGILRRLGCLHPYGDTCYSPSGCAAVIGEIAARVDARAHNPAFPSYFPRWIQFAVWSFGAEGGLNLCNGNQIDDRERCAQVFCPACRNCDRLALRPTIGTCSKK